MKKIFVLEDNIVNYKLIEFFFKSVNCTNIVWYQTIASAKDALESSQPEDFSALIFDIMLPDGLSTELALAAKQRHFGPVIAYTARAGQADRLEYAGAGFDQIIAKPVSFDDLKKGLLPYLTEGAKN